MLIDDETFERVQDVLAGRRIAGDRSWKHDHYLKGSLFCDRCESRLGLTYAKGRGGTYLYFYCLGRAKKRTGCDLPHLLAEKTEEHVIRYWQSVKLAPDLVELVRRSAQEELAQKKSEDAKVLASQRRRLQKLERQQEKLIDAYLAEALPVPVLKKRQEALAVEQREAERLIQLAGVDHQRFEQRLDIALTLLEHCDRLYIGAGDDNRRALNQGFFSELYVDRDGVKRAILNPPFAQLRDRSIGLAEEDEDDQDDPRDKSDGPRGPGEGRTKTIPRSKNPTHQQGPGSNLTLMAAGLGFEPRGRLRAQRFSRPPRSTAPAPRRASSVASLGEPGLAGRSRSRKPAPGWRRITGKPRARPIESASRRARGFRARGMWTRPAGTPCTRAARPPPGTGAPAARP